MACNGSGAAAAASVDLVLLALAALLLSSTVAARHMLTEEASTAAPQLGIPAILPALPSLQLPPLPRVDLTHLNLPLFQPSSPPAGNP